MIDINYKNAFKEVYLILQNTDKDLYSKIPNTFIQFLINNMNNEYNPNIQTTIPIDNQNLLKETESILSLIYRSYWATEDEKQYFAQKDKTEFIENEKTKKIKYKDISEIFDKKNKKDINSIILENNILAKQKENIFIRLINKIKKAIGF